MQIERNSVSILGRGWKFVSHIESDEVLITKALETSKTGSQHFSWLCLDVAEQRRARLPVKSTLPGGYGAPVLHQPTKELLYASSEGIMGYSFATKQERLHVPLDIDLGEVLELWLSPEKELRLAYLLREREDPKTQRTIRMSTVTKSLPVLQRYSLHIWTPGPGNSRPVTRFEAWPVSLDIDWSREMAFAFVGQSREKDLVGIDLKQNKVSILRTSDSASCVAVSPRHTLLTWGHNSPKVMESLPDGQEAPLTDFGWYPSFSPNEKRLAFSVEDYEIWTKDLVGGSAEKVVCFDKSSSQHTLDRITWCPCGEHFAVCMAGAKTEKAEDRDRRPLLIVDCGKREIFMYEDLVSIGTTGERIWVSTAAVKDLFTA